MVEVFTPGVYDDALTCALKNLCFIYACKRSEIPSCRIYREKCLVTSPSHVRTIGISVIFAGRNINFRSPARSLYFLPFVVSTDGKILLLVIPTSMMVISLDFKSWIIKSGLLFSIRFSVSIGMSDLILTLSLEITLLLYLVVLLLVYLLLI